MANEQDLLARTGQRWKLMLMPAGVLIGSPLILYAGWFQNVLPRARVSEMLIAGMALCIGALVVPCLAIRCPRCHGHWLWRIFRTAPADKWYEALHRIVRCPDCGFWG